MLEKRFRVAYAIQNVGGIDFSQDIGDTVPVKQTLAGLRRFGHEVTCFMLKDRLIVGIDDILHREDEWYAPQSLAGGRIFRFVESGIRRMQRVLKLPYFAFFDFYRFYEASYRCLGDYSLCHEHNGLFCGGAALASYRLGIPYVLTVSADPFLERDLLHKPLKGLHRFVAIQEARFTYRVARRIICVSEPAKQHLVKAWGVDAEKIVVMPNGVDVGLMRPIEAPDTARSELGLGDGPVVGFVGGFQPWHGLDLLIESIARIIESFPDAKLLLVGDGRARPVVDEKIAELGVEDSVKITGFMPQDRIPDLLALIDVAVLPYPKLPEELWFSPLKLFEYMATGKAIVASRYGQIAEVIQHGESGILVEPGDVPELTGAIGNLLKDPGERKRLGCNARQKAVEEHSWDRYIEKLEKIYFEAVH